MEILIDTQILLWLIVNDKRLSKRWIELIEDPTNRIRISIASFWEIAIKLKTGTLQLRYSLREVHDRFVMGNGITILPVSFEHIERLQWLPLHHRDPFDRIIIAQSLVEDIPIMTSDKHFSLDSVRLIEKT